VEAQILSNGRTVWANSGETGACLGRFSRFGIDIHHDIAEQDEKGQCLHCTHTEPTLEDWDVFKEKMKEHFDVVVTNEHRPNWLNTV
jgi:hypothetical protein